VREEQALENALLTATPSAPGAESLRVASSKSLEERVPDQRMHWKSFRKQQGQQLQVCLCFVAELYKNNNKILPRVFFTRDGFEFKAYPIPSNKRGASH
jgi:hypothetical protein